MYDYRTKDTHIAYEQAKQQGHLLNGCPLCNAESVEEFTHWKIIPNRFPYDRIASIHHMIIPKRHVVENELTKEELDELLQLKQTVLNHHPNNYGHILEAVHKKKSIPEHFHLHLLTPKTFSN